MRVFVTGARGFVGRWLTAELEGAGHEILAAPDRGRLELTDAAAVAAQLQAARPDAVVHLAAVSFAPDAAADPARAFEVNVGGTVNVMEAARSLRPPPAVLVTGSSEVYGAPDPADLPLRETS